jgi:hypothetical protein
VAPPVVPAAVKDESAGALALSGRAESERGAPGRGSVERISGRAEPPIARAAVPTVAPSALPRAAEAERAGGSQGAPARQEAAEGLDDAAAGRVNLALSQGSKDRQPAAAGKQRVAKRATSSVAPAAPSVPAPAAALPRRTRPAPAAKAPLAAPPPAAASASSNKLDCKQPFWIDEKGIRRLKMACL